MATNNDGFEYGFEIILDEVTPSEDVTQGGVRTDESRIVQYSGAQSDHTVFVRRLLAIDNFAVITPQMPNDKNLSLIILDYDLTSEGRFESIKTQLIFSDLPQTVQDKLAKPRVLASGPFFTRTEWNPSTEDQKRIRNIGLEVSAAGAVRLPVNQSNEVSKVQRFSNIGIAKKLQTEGGFGYWNGVKWIMKQNASQGSGTSPRFRVAVLFERSSDEPIRISYHFECKIGPWHNVKNALLKRFDSGLYKDVFITYTPKRESRFEDDDGKELYEKLAPFKDKLNELRNDKDQLVALTPVWGLEPGLDVTYTSKAF